MPNGTAVATHMIVVHLSTSNISRISFAAPDIELAAPDIELAALLKSLDIEVAAFLKSFPNSEATTSNLSSACVEKAVKNTISLSSLARIIVKKDNYKITVGCDISFRKFSKSFKERIRSKYNGSKLSYLKRFYIHFGQASALTAQRRARATCR
jgi:hypothetical protein